MRAPTPSSETARLTALKRYGVLDTPSEAAFNRITRLTAQVLSVPVAAVNFVDSDRVWTKSCVGAPAGGAAPRDGSFCAWTILADDVMVVPDATRDPRFAQHPTVQGEPRLHLYAGAPLITPDGQRIGTLSVTDTRPRDFGPREREILAALAAIVVDELRLRLREQEVRRSERFALTQADIARLSSTLSPEPLAVQAFERLAAELDVDLSVLVRHRDGEPRIFRAWSDARLPPHFMALAARGLAAGRAVLSEAVRQRLRAYTDDYPHHPFAVPAFREAGFQSVAWLHLGAQGPTDYVFIAVRLHGGPPWQRDERQLMEAAAHSLALALEREERLRDMHSAAYSDALTGLANRRAFEAALDALDAGSEPYSVAVIDLDGMKRVNDAEGHARGDALLSTFGRALTENLRSTDRVYRLGGDEYAVLLRHPDAQQNPDSIHSAVARHVGAAVDTTRGAGFAAISACVGWAHAPSDGLEPAALVRLADERMYEQKRARPQPPR